MGTAYLIIGWALTVLLGVLIGFLSGYAKKKGENLASKEDLQDVVAQVRAVTEATKRIEAEISTGMWDRQKRWEMKREVLFEATKRLAAVDDAMIGLTSVMIQDQANQRDWAAVAPPAEQRLAWEQRYIEMSTAWTASTSKFYETRIFASIVCGKETTAVFDDLGSFMNKLAIEIKKNPDAYRASRSELIEKIFAAQGAIRKELEVDGAKP